MLRLLGRSGAGACAAAALASGARPVRCFEGQWHHTPQQSRAEDGKDSSQTRQHTPRRQAASGLNAPEAVDCCRRAAAVGHVDAMRKLATLLFEGKGVQRDVREAITWYQKAADHGEPDAQFSLGGLFAEGCEGVLEKNPTKALEWYGKAAEQGHVRAQLRLGLMLYYGEGVEGREDAGFQWLTKVSNELPLGLHPAIDVIKRRQISWFHDDSQ